MISQQRSEGSTPLARLRRWLAGSAFNAVVLSHPSNVSWLSRGANIPIDRTSAFDPIWLVVCADTVTVVTTNVETDRVRCEFTVAGAGALGIVEVPWFSADYVAASVACAGSASAGSAAAGLGPAGLNLASDHPDIGTLVRDELTALRLTLDATEQQSLIELGQETTIALEAALESWRPGMTDLAVQAELISRLERAAIQTPVLIVGGDDRLERFRHPLANGTPMHHRVMAVVVARRRGVHVAVTRFADAEMPSPALGSLIQSVRAIESALLEAVVPGACYGDALDALAEAYSAAGHPHAWREHYQGGPIGFEQREFEIAPGQMRSRWYSEPIQVGHAIAFNPSLAGGAKSEDTYLVTGTGLRKITTSAPLPSPL